MTLEIGTASRIGAFNMSQSSRRVAWRWQSIPGFIFRGVVIFSVIALPALILAEPENPSAAQRASQLARSGHVEEALALLEKSLVVHPMDLDARLTLARLFAGNNEAGKAEQAYREALRRFPRKPEIREEFALLLARERKYEEAQSTIRLISPPLNPEARVHYYRLQASIDSGLGDVHAAAHAMEQALQSAPSDDALQYLTALTEAEAGDWESCLRNVKNLNARNPTVDSGLLLLRAQLAKREDFRSALQSLRALHVAEDQRLHVKVRSSELLAAANQHADAAEELEAAAKLPGGDDPALLFNLAVEQYSSGQFALALATIQSLRALNDSAELEDLAGDTQEQTGDRESAVRSHQNAIALAPKEERYRLSLGAELLKFGDYERAASVFEQGAQLFPNSARIYVGLGMSYYFVEKYDESVAAFVHADQLDGHSSRALNYLGATQVDNAAGPSAGALGVICARADSAKAEPKTITWCGALLLRRAVLANNRTVAPDVIRRLRLASKLEPTDPVAICSLGHALEWMEQLPEARQLLENCVRLRPDSAEDHYRLSRVYRQLGLKSAAAEQANLIDKEIDERDRRKALTDKFADEMLGQSKTIQSSK